MSKIKGELSSKIQRLIEKMEENLTDGEIIELRQYMFHYLLEMNCGLSKDGDCLPSYVKVGAIGNKHITLQFHGDDQNITKLEELRDFLDKNEDIYFKILGIERLYSMKEFLKKMERQEMLRLVNETNELFKLEDFKSEIGNIAENIVRINKLADNLQLKALLRINDLNLKELKELR